MLRIDFIKSMAGLIISPFIKNIFPKKNQVFLTDFYIAGFQYYEGNKVFPWLLNMEELILRREPTNEYDYYAIEVFTKTNIKLGYIPAYLNKIPARMIDQDVKLKVFISKINSDAPDWKKVKVKLYQIKTEYE